MKNAIASLLFGFVFMPISLFAQPLLDSLLPYAQVDTLAVKLRNENAGVWKKFGHAEKLVGGFELVTMGVLIAMPKRFTHWSANWMDDGVRNFKDAFTKPPVWDQDGWPVNYVCHPLCGSYYYNLVRSQNATVVQSFAFATAQSFIWEYVIEGVAERPSTQDLIFTPIAGMIIGETAHKLTMNMRRNGFTFFEKIFVIVFNPMFALNNGLSRNSSHRK